MSTETTRSGGFSRSPAEALNPSGSSGGCCGTAAKQEAVASGAGCCR